MYIASEEWTGRSVLPSPFFTGIICANLLFFNEMYKSAWLTGILPLSGKNLNFRFRRRGKGGFYVLTSNRIRKFL